MFEKARNGIWTAVDKNTSTLFLGSGCVGVYDNAGGIAWANSSWSLTNSKFNYGIKESLYGKNPVFITDKTMKCDVTATDFDGYTPTAACDIILDFSNPDENAFESSAFEAVFSTPENGNPSAYLYNGKLYVTKKGLTNDAPRITRVPKFDNLIDLFISRAKKLGWYKTGPDYAYIVIPKSYVKYNASVPVLTIDFSWLLEDGENQKIVKLGYKPQMDQVYELLGVINNPTYY